ncbi:MAG: M48 family metalloprotease, partial [Thermodesulfobacteriota bacterium]|nr:M48 family metalloprotease [Thermodesulfobacteriota bacterium]
IILGFLGSIAAFPLTAISNYISRRHEIEADRIAYKLTGNARSIITALVKLSKDNLSNLYPHPVYVALYYSHPPILERIRFIDEMDARQKSNEII